MQFTLSKEVRLMANKCGYSFWGYLGDVKYNRDGEVASTPDGNAFYSWCIIRELQRRGYKVTQLMPDRDDIGYLIHGEELFGSWVKTMRKCAYTGTKKIKWWEIIGQCKLKVKYNKGTEEYLLNAMKEEMMAQLEKACDKLEFILHEYRMLIPGRNDPNDILSDSWQPDYLIQECLFEYCCKSGKRLILFDLDYKLDFEVYRSLKERGCNVCILELGLKWQAYSKLSGVIHARRVYIPFDFSNINYFDVNEKDGEIDLVYVGNRYERDWCVDKYMSKGICKCAVYGNWLENGRDSSSRWPDIDFRERLQTRDMRDAYCEATATIMLAKKEYCKYEFMTARILEAIFYGAVPLFIEEFGEKTIKKYAGEFTRLLTVKNNTDVAMTAKSIRTMGGDNNWVKLIIEYLRDRLSFMDVKNFVDVLMEVK